MIFQIFDFCFRIYYRILIFFQLRRNIPLWIWKCLLSYVMLWHHIQIWLRNFNKITKNFVEFYFHISNSSRFSFPLLNIQQKVLPGIHNISNFIQFLTVPRFYNSAFPHRKRCIFIYTVINYFITLKQNIYINALKKISIFQNFHYFNSWFYCLFQCRQIFPIFTPKDYFPKKPLQIINILKFLPQIFTNQDIINKILNILLPFLYFINIQKRIIYKSL